MTLTVKQEAFCLEYAASGNATQSYKNAGYKYSSDGVARVQAARLLAKPNIRERLRELAEETASRKIADIREVQERLTEILRMNLDEDQVVVEGCGDGISEAKIIKRKAQLKDVLKAGELLAKMQGAFDNKLQVELTVPVFGGDDDLED